MRRVASISVLCLSLILPPATLTAPCRACNTVSLRAGSSFFLMERGGEGEGGRGREREREREGREREREREGDRGKEAGREEKEQQKSTSS